MLRRIYDWVMALAARPDAMWALAAISFIESSVFPIPPDVLLIPMVLAARTRWLKIAFVCTVASVLGGMLGYAIGFLLYEAIGRPILEFYGLANKFAEFQSYYNDWGIWIVLGAGATPFPYKFITIASGVTQLDIVTFSAASVVGRGARFFSVAALLWWYGPPIRTFIEKRLGLVFTVFVVLLLAGFVAIRYLL